jgi:cytochrome P450
MNAPIATAPRMAPEPFALPVLGHAPWLLRDAMAFLAKAHRRHGPMFGVRVGPYRYLLAGTPAAIRHVLVDNAQAYEKGAGLDGMRTFLGQGLITSDGGLWRRQRRTLNPAFTSRAVDATVATMAEVGEAFARELDGRRELDVHAAMLKLALRVAARALFDFDPRADEALIARSLDTALRYAVELGVIAPLLPLWVPTPRNVRVRRLVASLHDLADRVSRRSGERDDALALLLAAKEAMGPALFRDEVLTLLLASHETAAAALSWTLSLLSLHPEARAAVERELAEVLGDRPASAADLPRLTFTSAVVQESMRLYPPVWWLERQALADDVVDGYAVPKGSFVAVCTQLVHRDPALWPEPERFLPERFIGAAPPRYYLPFGGGARTCIGAGFARAELVVLLAALLRRHRFDLLRAELPRPEHLVTLRPKGRLPMRVSAR